VLNLDRVSSIPKDRVRSEIGRVVERLLEEERVPMTTAEQTKVVEEVLDEVLGLGPLEPLLKDHTISDILVNRSDLAYIERNGKKCPPTLTDSKWLTLSKLGVELLFDIDTKNERYPSAPKGKSFIPYLTTLNVTSKKLQLPFGVTSAWTTDDLTLKFGEPSKHNALPRWHVPLIPARDVVLSYYGLEDKTIYLRLKCDHERLSRPG